LKHVLDFEESPVSLGLTDDQRSLADSVAEWARSRATTDLVRRSEETGQGVFEETWTSLAGLGLVTIAVPEGLGGGGGSVLDLACALEACAASLVPGPLLSTAVAVTAISHAEPSAAAADVVRAVVDGSASLGLALDAGDVAVDGGVLDGVVPLAWGAGDVTHVLVGAAGDRWFLLDVAADGVVVEAAVPVDLSRAAGTVRLRGAVPVAQVAVTGEQVRTLAAALAAAEAAGVARWSLRTAVEHAKVREQFGRVIGSFQAVKHLCAEMLERAESATAVAWDAAAAQDEPREQQVFAAAVAASVALDAAVANAQDCIQVLGGIGFTWEHDAHLYLRRAMSTRLLLGGSDRWRAAVTDLALTGVRRSTHIDLDGADEHLRDDVRAEVSRVAAVPGRERRLAMAEAGLVAPHYPPPYGRGAGAVEQLVIEDELAAAGIRAPELAIGAWALPTILEHGDDAQRERFVMPTLRGEIAWCQLFSEPGAGSDLASLRTRADRVEGGWSLTGQKVWTSLAREADWAICLARTDPDAKPHRGITYFLLDMSTPGIDIRPLREITGEAVFNEVFLDGVVVPDDCVVGEVNGGWPLARTTLANERVAMGGRSLGTSVERALAVVAGCKEPDTATRVRLGAAVAEATTVKVLGLRSTLRAVAGVGPGPESSVSKLVGVRQRQDSSELVLDLMEEAALLGGADATAAWQEALLTRCLSIAGGTTQILRNVAAERILGLPR
jgi:alkylation response protein AidB-like acyl-CoA dehydrogenase